MVDSTFWIVKEMENRENRNIENKNDFVGFSLRTTDLSEDHLQFEKDILSLTNLMIDHPRDFLNNIKFPAALIKKLDDKKSSQK